MNSNMNNQFSSEDTDRHDLWDMLVHRDIKAFVQEDWDLIADDFIEQNFMGIDACYLENPDAWKLNFPNLEAYKNAWLKQARLFNETEWGEDPEAALFRVTILRDIEIKEDSALIHKKFLGNILKANGELMPTNWQTLYQCKKIGGVWKIAGFTGYLPHFLDNNAGIPLPTKQIPAGASQHKTAGPYSSVLVVNPGKLVVISGQAAIDMEGNVIGNTIETQTAYTLDNCRKQLESAGCSLKDAFKVTVYLKDLSDWPRFNEVYKKYFFEPLPVRTAVQAGLLMTLLVEIEIWAVKS
jgi:enamine deaminase RidA (YjgF/YER057c/UK114 family)